MQTLEAEQDIMSALKAGTAQQHESLERLMPFFHDPFTLTDYIQTLQSFLGFFEPMEEKLASALGWPTLGIDLTRRRRAHLLRADLQTLGVSEAAIAAVPRCTELPSIRNRYNGLGSMYVLEGSTLGGQMIGRELERRFSIGEATGASFFLSHGRDVGRMWKEFCGAMRSYVNDPVKHLDALTAARETFVSFEQWMLKVSAHA